MNRPSIAHGNLARQSVEHDHDEHVSSHKRISVPHIHHDNIIMYYNMTVYGGSGEELVVGGLFICY